MTLVLTRPQIEAALENIDVLPLIEAGFVAYSAGSACVPPVGELLLTDPPGEAHIKYGFIHGGAFFVVKVATGFPGNTKLGLPSGDGLMLAFDQQTGRLHSVLLDEGLLTDVRTAAAGAVAARYLAPTRVERIGVLGTGVQGRLQLEHLLPLVSCRSVLVWGRSQLSLDRYAEQLCRPDLDLETTMAASTLAESCNLIVAATPATQPLLKADDIRPGTHITSVGSDTPEKNELDPQILAKADRIVADSVSQCRLRGEIHQALAADAIADSEIVELGAVISRSAPGRSNDQEITVADLTGVAVQDIQIAVAVIRAIAESDT